MTLTKRLVLLVLPILLVGVFVAAAGMYQVQSDTLTEVEQTKLDLKLQHAKAQFEQDASVAANVASLLLDGETLPALTRSAGKDVEEYLVTQKLDRLIDDVLSDGHTRLLVTVIDDLGNPIYHHERSDNPFSETPKFVLNFARSSILKRTQTSSKLMFINSFKHAYVHGRVLDASTFLKPFRVGSDNNIVVVVTSYTEAFDRDLRTLQETYGVTPKLINRLPSFKAPDEAMTRSIEILPNFYLELELTDAYLRHSRTSLVDWLIAVSLIFGVTVAAVLLYLIRRYIIRPIEILDDQLDLVTSAQQNNIQRPVGTDELSRLGIKFYDLYDQLNTNLNESRNLAITDSLTKLPNRTRFQEFAKRAIVRAWNRKTYVSLIYIDLDNFKFVNDRLGHEAGDELLKFAANAFESLLQSEKYRQQGTLVSRLAGDEFAIVLAHDDLKDRENLAADLVGLFDGGFKTDRYLTPVSASVGVASYPEDGEDLRELIANADMAMYHAKRSGKSRFSTYSHSIAGDARRVKLIEDALKFVNCDDEFSLVFMPFVDQAGEIKGLEVLLRWYSAELGHITPDEFVPIAEQTGTYSKIDDWVFRNAFDHISKLCTFLGDDIVVAINISAAELGQADFASKLIRLKEEYNVSDGAVELEITETFGYFAVEQVLVVLRGLRDAGFGISIDDFGIGYTPLLQMIDYPVDKVKFDKELVQRLTNDQYRQLLEPTVELCHLQSIKVTAEGVEDLDKLSVLRHAGCDYFQGYSIAQPMSLVELREWHERYLPLKQ
ncbi:hypothetical protein DN730_01335 [Marinomonas piezotolerans]|uniref:GGDEF-domain containing protein n=1 Tax=Marinomonas piezotolerans TaxID=2213058 RepID=A0A370UD49_9GAMM|nr:EAL domain-containing protein [Marinomonas piezotolerans]RDL45720.1 hypothetical protein DN730_01335 [Marinomonas piezotolerans]